MPAKLRFKKQLCHICLQSFSPIHLVKINLHNICHNCLRLVELSERNPPPPQCRQESDTEYGIDSIKQNNLACIIAREGAAFMDQVNQLNTITPGLIGSIIGRAAIYLPGLLYLNEQSEWYPIISGIMTADFVTWFIFNIMQLPFISKGAVLEFLIYGGITSFLVSQDRLINIPNEGPPMAYAALAFMATSFAKTAYWGVKVFIFEEIEEN